MTSTLDYRVEKSVSSKSKRESGIELLRIFLMFSIVAGHCFSYYIKHFFEANESLFIIKFFISTVLFNPYVSVSCFVFISGYYGLKFKLNQLISLIFQALFYSYLSLIAVNILMPEWISFSWIFKYLFPISSFVWWFITVYIILYILSPLLNKGIPLISKTQYKILLICLFYINSFSYLIYENALGGQLVNFLFIYIFASYIKIYNITIKWPLLVYLISSLLIFAVSYIVSIYANEPILRLATYNSPFTIISAASLFFVFKNIKFDYSWVYKIAPLCLGVYLIHYNVVVWNFIITNLLDTITILNYKDFLSFTIITLGLAILIFIISLFIEKLRQIICQPLLNFVVKKIDNLKLNT